jgi:hypothetical protein
MLLELNVPAVDTTPVHWGKTDIRVQSGCSVIRKAPERQPGKRPE